MPDPRFILVGAAGAAVLVSAVGSFVALWRFAKRGESMLGFDFHRYYWGAMRREHPGTFRCSVGGALAAMALLGLAAVLRWAGS